MAPITPVARIQPVRLSARPSISRSRTFGRLGAADERGDEVAADEERHQQHDGDHEHAGEGGEDGDATRQHPAGDREVEAQRDGHADQLDPGALLRERGAHARLSGDSFA
ncbi:hypothetical protein [Nannocystis pusilla]|uniref:hypothetical protein n=1 Tax=Nannocystis pusilla TaxID=889268 RepID=UPI003DA315BF